MYRNFIRRLSEPERELLAACSRRVQTTLDKSIDYGIFSLAAHEYTTTYFPSCNTLGRAITNALIS